MEEFTELVNLVDVLRGENGCPWDREQTRETLKPMLVEEAFEVIEALDRPSDLCEELGDLLFQVIFHARIAKERAEFDIGDVVRGIVEKMVRRHPHVFGADRLSTSAEVLVSWEAIKKGEKAAAGRTERGSLLDGIPQSLPALYRAWQLSSKAARVGFDWPDLASVAGKMREELDELAGAHAQGDADATAGEIGDILFAAVNLARKCGVDPETALSRTNRKFQTRFQRMEKSCAEDGIALETASLEQMEARWQEAKRLEAGE